MYGSLMQKACKVHDMASVTDYRRLAHHHRGLFFTDDEREEELQARFQEVAQPHSTRPIRVDVIMGRTLDVAQAGKQPRQLVTLLMWNTLKRLMMMIMHC
jgi:predicted ATPase